MTTGSFRLLLIQALNLKRDSKEYITTTFEIALCDI